MAIFCCEGSLHGCCLIRASSHGPGIGRSRFSVAGATLSLSARIVNAASTAPAESASPMSPKSWRAMLTRTRPSNPGTTSHAGPCQEGLGDRDKTACARHV